MLTVSQALQTVLSEVTALPPIRVPLPESCGLVLAQEVLADRDSPAFDNSAVDGYAVISADTSTASADDPTFLNLIAEVSAGSVWTGTLEPGTTVKTMTGAPVPQGADAIVMREDVSEESGRVHVMRAARRSEHIRWRGEDIKSGQKVLGKGLAITASEVGALAAFGVAQPVCFPQARVAVFSTGDELVSVDSTPGPGQIRDSNRIMLESLVREAGGIVVWSQHLPDNMEATRMAFRNASDAMNGLGVDVIVTSGGVSVGDRDFVKPVVEELGQLKLWRVAMKPGKPLAFGQIGNSIFLGLPGNPVSTLVTFELFVRPVLKRLAGHLNTERTRVTAGLTESVDHTPGREEYVRVRLSCNDEGWRAEPMGHQGSNRFRSMLGWNGLAIIRADLGPAGAGDHVPCLITAMPESSH